MKKLFLFLLLVGFVACSDKNSDFGSQWVSVSTRNVIIDTCTVDISTGMLDSIQTSNGNSLFVGNFEDEYFGKTTAIGYFIFMPSHNDFVLSFDENNKERLFFDSLTMLMRMYPDFCGDTTQVMTFNVCQLKRRMELNDDGEFFAHNSFEYGEPLATYSFRPTPRRDGLIEFRMPDSLGIKMLQLLKENSDSINTLSLFERFQRGFALVPDPSVNQIISIENSDSTFALKLSYHTSGAVLKEEHVMYFSNNKEVQCNHFKYDRRGTPTENVTNKFDTEIPSIETDSCSFIHGFSGIYTRIKFPYLNEIQKIGTHGVVRSAKLYVYPKENSYGEGKYGELSGNISMYISNESNVNISEITDDSEEIDGSLIYDHELKKATHYEYDITSFIKSQIGVLETGKLSLQMIMGKYGGSTENVVISQQNRNLDYRIKLEIKYSVYNEK